MRCSPIVVSILFLVMLPGGAFAKDAEGASTLLDRIGAFHAVEKSQRFVAEGSGYVTDSSHPRRPEDFNRHELKVRLVVDAYRGDATIDFESGGEPETDRYLIRRGRPFQLDDTEKTEREPSPLGDLEPPMIAALHPSLVARALTARRENVELVDAGSESRPATLLFAWNDELWRIHADRSSGRIVKLERHVYSDVFGDGSEEIRFEDYRGNMPHRIVSVASGREIFRLELTSAVHGSEVVRLPEESDHWDAQVIAPEDIAFREIAPRLYTIDLTRTNSRVIVAEFEDHLAVIEGAYNSRNGDLLARAIEERFGKPIRYFSFSHLHGQYVGGTRSYIQKGATVIVPESTVPLIDRIASAKHAFRPDAQARNPKPLRLRTVKSELVLTDEINSMAIYNVESGHTDEYLIFHFPRQKVLITGDLLFYRGPEQPLRGRSKQLCETVTKLGLEVEMMYVSWPLEGYGVHNSVGIDEFRAACGEPAP